jgi:hypothetical protein
MKKRFVNPLFNYVICIVFIFINGCKKQDKFLDEKPNQALAIPTTLEDFQSLLNNDMLLNTVCDPSLGTISGDEFYVTTDVWSAASTPAERNAYIFAQSFYQGSIFNDDWNKPYQQIYYANIILNGLDKISIPPGSQSGQYNQIKGSALFIRANAFYNLVQTFSMPYDSVTANTDMGIALRLSPDLNIKSTRASVKQCYDQILADLKEALSLLPATSNYKTRPSKLAANALLARVYLGMRDYTKAFEHSNACLLQNNTLTDFNTLSPTSFSISNDFLAEDIYHTSLIFYSLLHRRNSIVDSNLYRSYDSNDLRKSLYFFTSSGQIRFRGTYDYNGNKFSGLATDEMYLIRAECNARFGNLTSAMNDLNTLLIKRWKTNTFNPLIATSANDALIQILNERKKELIFRGLRWTDLRRLNKETGLQMPINHIINGVTYKLLPNDPKYALPIPDNEIQLSNLLQNPR